MNRVVVTVNGESREVAEGASITQLLASLGFGERRVAVEVNRRVVPKSEFEDVVIGDGDVIEIVSFVGGG